MKFFVTRRFYTIATILVLSFIVGYYYAIIYSVALPLLWIFLLLVLFDSFLLFSRSHIDASRHCSDRFSNGDMNVVSISVVNDSSANLMLKVADEAPYQFQLRGHVIKSWLRAGESRTVKYELRPVYRGVYSFGQINILAATRLGLVVRRFIRGKDQVVKVYPAFLALHKYEIMAISDSLELAGHKRVRRVGNSQEFDTIKEYVPGDDPRHINWSATARAGSLMTNHFVDEKSQDIYSFVDKSRVMQMPFNGMTLLDYSINAALVLSDIARKKSDRVGLLTYEDRVDTFVKSSSSPNQLHKLMEALYKQQTSFKEVDLARMYTFTQKMIGQRSLVLLFTNYESVHSMRRQLDYLRLLNRKHLLIVVFFRNNEVDRLLEDSAVNTREIYDQSIGYQLLAEKRLIMDELRKAGITSIYTSPEKLNVNVVNKYIEIKRSRIL